MDVKSILTESSQFLAPILRFEITINISQEDLTHKRKDSMKLAALPRDAT